MALPPPPPPPELRIPRLLFSVYVQRYNANGRGSKPSWHDSLPFDEAAALVHELRKRDDIFWAFMLDTPDEEAE